jgi:plasmid replication initiation protein
MEIIALEFNNLNPESLDSAVVRKHNDLIEARYQLPNLQEQRVIFMLLAQIKPDDEDFKGYRIAVADFAKVMGITNKNVYADMEGVTRSLRNREIGIRNGQSFFYTGWLSSVEYKHGSGYVELCFDPKLKPYLLQLKDHFTQYKLASVLHFKSIYAIRLYEMLKKEAYRAKRQEKSNVKKFEIQYSYELIRESFGVDKKEYAKFNDFKRKTIEPAVREVTDKTDLNIFEIKYLKTGRKVSDIKFVVLVRSPDEAEARVIQGKLAEIPKEKPDIHPAVQALIDRGFAFETAQSLFKKHGVKRIERNLAYLLAEEKAGKDIHNKAGYLAKALEEDWGNALEVQAKKKQELEAQKQAEAEKKRFQELEEQRKAELLKNNNIKIIKVFLTLPSGIKEMVKKSFVESIQDNKFKLECWNKVQKLNNDNLLIDEPLLRGEFAKFLSTNQFTD